MTRMGLVDYGNGAVKFPRIASPVPQETYVKYLVWTGENDLALKDSCTG